MKVTKLVGKNEILAVLETDRLYAAYAIGDLANGWFEHCQWSVAGDSAGPSALALVYDHFNPPALFLMGTDAGMGELLSSPVCPPESHVTLRTGSLETVNRYYRLSEARHMWRMWVDAGSFLPVQATTKHLTPAHINDLNELYAWGGADYFAAYQLDQGVYYAVSVNGKLVAAAGTHVVAPEYHIAAVGNVYTHPAYRNHGHAKACTSAVVAHLLGMGCTQVVLNVWQDNAPAVQAYTRLGFAIHCPFIESPAQRRSSIMRRMHILTHH